MGTGRMLDKQRFRKKLLLGLLTSPLTLCPLVVGVTLLFAAWALSIKSGVALFAALACVLGAAGVFFTRLLLGDGKIAKAAVEEMQKEAHEAREKGLDELDRKLTEDGDSRTEASLRDLRALATAFNEARPASAGLSAGSAFDIASGVEQLFNRCVQSLARTLDLWRTAQKMVTPEAKKPILEQRESIIEDVGKSITQLGKVLAGIQGLESGGGESSELAGIREELDQRLAVAKRVEERMRSLDKEYAPGQFESPGETK